MIKKDNFKNLLNYLGFNENSNFFTKSIDGADLKVNFNNQEIIYPEDKGLKVNERQTCDFSSNENFVVFECVHRLLEKGYKPEHLELEPKWKVGHGTSGGRADILVRNQENKPLLIIECKTVGGEFNKAWRKTQQDGDQLFSYAQQISETQYLCLYASDFEGGEINFQHKIISHKDNAKILEQDKQLNSFAKATDVKNRFEVWKETYQQEYTETGIFEENIQPYQIGKNKYTLDDDTRPVTDTDKEGKYHDFRTILRQHNIARRETAFEVLVNLFLAKIVDEEENKNDLKFYWKGIAYDNYYDFIDRLQKLYQIGMRKFLKDEVMYISNTQIDAAFWTVKNKRNATKRQIQEYFRKLKFFSNNAFSLINVHNERLFKQNTNVLVEIVQMWQGLRLKTNAQNQFLGDMFEFFLDNSIKQSEGQFFTPSPICKFIVASLPLADKIQSSSEPLKAIDFACGAGHFLTEYAHQIKPLVEKYKKTDIGRYFENIVGIEKEDRLAKIAKVSAYMYGQDQIKILEEDALGDVADIQQTRFDVLVANPPFAVEGFLLNLDDKQKQIYRLTETTKSNSNTNNIQCFFIERAKQLMSPDGVVGIIVPSSVLSNSDATHIGTREIILKYFDIISIVELGSGTFGKTGTNTVVLFLRRKKQRPEPVEHYQNRVEDYFEGIQEGDPSTAEYQDLYLIKKYCEHTELPYEEYTKLFGITTDTLAHLDDLFNMDIFADYKKDFESSADIKNLKNKKIFKSKPKQEQAEAINKRLIAYLYAIEKDKLLYFMLAFENPQKVLIVKSPSENKQQKQFLGYEWSSAKGSEGIRYNGGSTVNDIITPLFNPKSSNDPSKINHLIQQNFLEKEPNDLKGFEEYKDLITYANVADILDFSRKDFNKSFSLSPNKNISIDTQWELVKLGEVAEIQSGGTPKSEISAYWNGNINWATLVDTKEKCLYSTVKKITQEGLNKSSAKLLPINTVIFSSRATIGEVTIAKVETATNQGYKNFICDNDKIHYMYLYEVLRFFSKDIEGLASGMTYKEISKNEISNFKIPLPPIRVQQKIVVECESIDKESDVAQQTINEAKKKIEEIVTKEQKENKKLDEVISKISETINPKSENGEVHYVGLENIEGNTGQLVGDIKLQYSEIKSNKTVFQKGDILYGKLRPNLNKSHKANFDGICSTDILVFRVNNTNLSNYYKHYFLSKIFNGRVLKTVSGQQLPRTSWDKIKNFKIPVPPLSEQEELVSTVEKLETIIAKQNAIIDVSVAHKNAILKRHL